MTASEMPARDHYFRAVMTGQLNGPAAILLRATASLAEPFYAAVLRLRNRGYDRDPGKSQSLPRPTISVGNLSVGGTGKTPMVATLARALIELGHRPAVLTRGYRAKPGAKADEQLELESLLGPSVPVVANPDRLAGAATALQSQPATTLFLLDDGFQHRRVRRDLDLVLVSATQGLSGNHVLPRGLLREPASGLKRASVILVTRADQINAAELDRLRADLSRRAPNVPILVSRHVPTHLTDFRGSTLPLATLQNRKVLAVAGTGDPDAFLATLEKLGAEVAGEMIFADHHPYGVDDADAILATAEKKRADLVVTTAKDAVKLRPLVTRSREKVATLDVSLTLDPVDASKLLQIVAQKIKRPHGGG